MVDSLWTNEMKMDSYNDKVIIIGKDLKGDIEFNTEPTTLSITINKIEAVRLREWLNQFIDEGNKDGLIFKVRK